MSRKHIVIPDLQIGPERSIDHLKWIHNYIEEKKPDVVVLLGDVADMPSLCSYERGKQSFEGRRYAKDIDAVNIGLKFLTGDRYLNGDTRWVCTLGNHEERINTMAAQNPELMGAISIDDINFKKHNIKVHPYLKPVVIDGVAYCHQFVRNASGTVFNTKWGAPSARAQVQREARSCTAGHKPGIDLHIQPAGNRSLYGLIAGSCYLHNEHFHSPQGNRYWRGIIVKHEVRDGQYDPMLVSLSYLKRRYS